LDNVTEFNIFVKPFLGLLGAAVGIGSSLLGARSAKKAAGRAKSAQMGAIGAAEEQYRDPSDIFGQIYPELYGPATQDIILGAERRLMPEYQALQFERMGMLTPELLQQQRAFQEARLAELADIEMEEAQRLTEEAREGLSPLEIIKAERRAAQQGIARGRELGASQIARSALERREAEEDVQARRAELARAARMGAGRAAGAARVDPFTAILGRTPSAYQTAAQLSLGPLGAMTTSPSTALGLGQAEDYRRAQAELAYGGVESAYQQARGQIQSNMFGSIGQSLGGFIGGLGSTGGSTVSPIAQNPMTTGYGTVLAPPTGGFQLPGVSTAQGILGTYGR
jgi:hypothetical protein